MRAVLRFTPAFDPRIVDDPSLARELMVQRGALETVTPGQPIPVVVDHDLDRQVGHVTDMYVNADTAGGHWYFAHVAIDEPPGWLRRDGGVSWSHIDLRSQDVNGTTRLLRGLVKEISILSPTVQPAEPRARVVWIGERQDSPAVRQTTSDRAAGEVILGGQRIERHGIGQVLGVR